MFAASAVGRDISLRHPLIASLAVDKMQSLAPNFTPDQRHTIGTVYFRNDRFKEAAAWLEESLTQSQGEFEGFDLYVLSMAYQRRSLRTEPSQRPITYRISLSNSP